MTNLQFYVSSELEQLLAQLAINIKKSTGNILRPTELITQTQGMNTWLSVSLARPLGISINMQFRSPAQFLMHVYKVIGGKRQYTLSQGNIDWLVYDALGQTAFQKKYRQVATYFGDNDKKRMDLATKVADLLDQYQVYRPEMITAWDKEELIEQEDRSEQWQATLWQMIKKAAGNALPEMRVMRDYILQQLKDPIAVEQVKKHIGEAHLFGLSTFTPFHIELFYELSRIIPFYMYLLNPAPSVYWTQDRSEQELFVQHMRGRTNNTSIVGNQLLTNWGKLLQGTFAMLYQDDTFLNLQTDLSENAPRYFAHTLLGKVQQNINDNIPEGVSVSSEDLEDGTLQISSSYSIVREVEALYSYLVDTLASANAKGEPLTTRDILVIVSDVQEYGPYIKAVFDNAPYQFKYSIADETLAKGNNVPAAILALLQIHDYNVSAETVLQLLDFPAIRQRFGIEDIELCRRAVTEAGIKFGIENEQEIDTYLLSFRYGIQRIMFGLCMAGEQLYHAPKGRQLYTTDVADSNIDMQTLTRFVYFVESLFLVIKLRSGSKTLLEWRAYIVSLVARMLSTEEVESEDKALLDRLTDYERLSGLMKGEKVAYNVFSKKITALLSGEEQANKFLNTGITFCTPIPFRSIPFKLVAMLGMNFDKFPRQNKTIDFDLLTRKPRIGDRNLKYNDKHLFLESVMSAQRYLYLSYVGKNIRDSSELPPSILIDELLEYIAQGTDGVDVNKALVRHHPLHSYSYRYNSGNGMNNYMVAKDATLALLETKQVALQELGSEISLSHIQSFAADGIKYFYEKVLKIYLEGSEAMESETELIDIASGLDAWKIKDQLLTNWLQQDENDSLIQSMYLHGQLPLLNMKKVKIEMLSAELNELQNAIKGAIEQDGMVINKQHLLEINASIVKGMLPYISAQKQLILPMISSNGSNSKYLAKAYIQYLFGKALGVVEEVLFFGKEKKDITIFRNKNLSQQEAKERLQEILEAMDKAQSHMPLHQVDLVEENCLNLDAYLSARGDKNDYFSHAHSRGMVAQAWDEQSSDNWLLHLHKIININATECLI